MLLILRASVPPCLCGEGFLCFELFVSFVVQSLQSPWLSSCSRRAWADIGSAFPGVVRT